MVPAVPALQGASRRSPVSVGIKAFGALAGNARQLILLVGATWGAPRGGSI